MKPPPVAFRLKPAQYKAYKEVAAANGQTFSQFAREALITAAKRRVESITDPETKALVASLPEEVNPS